MNTMTGCEFVDSRVELDGTHFESCRFVRCVFVYRGGRTGFVDCDFEEPNFEFHDAAGNTLGFLAAMYAGGGTAYVERVFAEIRGTNGPSNGFMFAPSEN